MACSARYNRGVGYFQRVDVAATVESLVARIRATAGGRPPTFTRLARASDWYRDSFIAEAPAFLLLSLLSLRDRQIVRIVTPAAPGARAVGPVAPLAVDAVAYRTLVESDARIGAKFPGTWGSSCWGCHVPTEAVHREQASDGRAARGPRDRTWPPRPRSSWAPRPAPMADRAARAPREPFCRPARRGRPGAAAAPQRETNDSGPLTDHPTTAPPAFARWKRPDRAVVALAFDRLAAALGDRW